MAEVDAAAGEWRCRCPSDPEFDTSVNPSFFKRCGKCGMKRPKPPEAEPAPVDGWSALVDACPNCGFSTPEYGLKEGYIKRAAPMPCKADSEWGCEARKKLGVARGVLSKIADGEAGDEQVFEWPEFYASLREEARQAFEETGYPQPCEPDAADSSGAAKENHYFCMGCGVTLMPSWGMSCSPGCARTVRESMANNKKEVWEDGELPEDGAISAAHPMESKRYDLYIEAMRLVGAKQSKGALVDLVNWLLHGADAVGGLQAKASQYRKEAAEWEAKYNELRSAKK